MDVLSGVISRAKPLLGTVVSIQVVQSDTWVDAERAMQRAFGLIAHLASVMSAHEPLSDLGRLSRGQPGEVLTLDPHTVAVLQAAQYWMHQSAGAFNPARAGLALARRGRRPGLKMTAEGPADVRHLTILSEREVQLHAPVSLDFGGIAKGYAVDQAATCLMQHGVSAALINAGGDLRIVGEHSWPIEIVHARQSLRDHAFQKPLRMAHGALATSSSLKHETEFVLTLSQRRAQWTSATVRARDCMTADVLTKWALQSSPLCPRLKTVLRYHHAQMWRS